MKQSIRKRLKRRNALLKKNRREHSVPRLQQIWGRLPRKPENLTVLQPHPGDGTGHSFSSHMYQKPIEKIVEQYVNGEFDESP